MAIAGASTAQAKMARAFKESDYNLRLRSNGMATRFAVVVLMVAMCCGVALAQITQGMTVTTIGPIAGMSGAVGLGVH